MIGDKETNGYSSNDSWGKSNPEQIQKRRDSIAPMEVNKVNLISDALKVELKQLINEVLDESV